MRFNRKAAQRAIDLAVDRNDARIIPFNLAFVYNLAGNRGTAIGVRQPFDLYMWLKYKDKTLYSDTSGSVRFNVSSSSTSSGRANYQYPARLRPALKPRSLKKHELRKQARELRRMKQYD